jgi:hypothetical protein
MRPKKHGYYLIRTLNLSKDKYERWIKLSKTLKLSGIARQPLSWIIFYYTKAEQNASLTCTHFAIARSQWYYWFNRFDEDNLLTLENKPTTPKKKRQREYTSLQYERIVELRKSRISYGKEKILKLYKDKYPNDSNITSWKVQCIIQKAKIYFNPKKPEKTLKKRYKSSQKKRITELKKQPKTGYLLCLDTIVKYWNGQKR